MGWWVYLLRCADGTLYCGIARDVAARVRQHERGAGAKYTRGRGPFTVVYVEPAADRSQAAARERAIKRLTREEKVRLITPVAP
jgi:putative endonuclease